MASMGLKALRAAIIRAAMVARSGRSSPPGTVESVPRAQNEGGGAGLLTGRVMALRGRGEFGNFNYMRWKTRVKKRLFLVGLVQE